MPWPPKAALLSNRAFIDAFAAAYCFMALGSGLDQAVGIATSIAGCLWYGLCGAATGYCIGASLAEDEINKVPR